MQVAVKMLTPAALSLTKAALDFKQEVFMSIQAAQSCSQACRVFGYSYVNKQLCLVMEHHDKSLQALLKGKWMKYIKAKHIVSFSSTRQTTALEGSSSHVCKSLLFRWCCASAPHCKLAVRA